MTRFRVVDMLLDARVLERRAHRPPRRPPPRAHATGDRWMHWTRSTLVPIAALIAALSAAPAAAQADGRPMTIADIMSIRHVGGVDLSPDGSEVVYSVSGWYPEPERPEPAEPREPGDSIEPADLPDDPDTRSNLWLVSTSGGLARPLTHGERGGRSPAWSPDGSRIAFIASREGAEEEGSQVWVLPRDGGEAWPLTASPTGVQGFAWSPDGTRIAYVATDTLSKEEAERRRRRDDARVYEEDHRLTHVWVIDVATKEATEVGHGDFTVRGAPSWAPDGERLTFAASPTPMIRDLRGGIWVADLSDGSLERVAPAVRSYAYLLSHPAWSPDGRTLAYPSMPLHVEQGSIGMPNPPVGHRELVLYDVATGRTRVIDRDGFDRGISELQWTPDGRRLLFVSGDGAYEGVFQYDLDADRFSRLAQGLLLGDLSFSRDGRTVAFERGTADAPAEVYIADADFSDLRRLTDTNPWLDEIALGETEVVRWTSPDGTEVEGVLVKPVGHEEGRRYPLLVEAHGGPTGVTTAGFKGTPGSPGQLWAGRGWAVLYPNPRGSTNYGEAFMRANVGDWGGGDYEDVMSGVDAIIARGIADPDRLAFLGWSYGGYLAARVVTRTDRFRAARMGAGMSNIASMYLTTDIPGYIASFFGGPPGAETFEGYMLRSPVSEVERVTTPLLILHGAGDERVPTGQALEFYRALRNAGKVVELVFYPRAGHGIGEYHHQVDRMQRDYAWMSRYTLGEEGATGYEVVAAEGAGR